MRPALALCAALFAGLLDAQTANPLTTAVTERFNRLRLDFEESADLMPAEKYGFRLTDSQRSFGEWIAHAATGNYNFCAAIRSEKAPEAVRRLAGLKTKPELSQALKESFTYCADTLKQTEDQKALASQAAVRGMINLVSSGNEHYGNIVGYMRTNNLVPPSTTRAERKQQKQ